MGAASPALLERPCARRSRTAAGRWRSPWRCTRRPGRCPRARTPTSRPVRPKPDWTSSAMSRMPCSSQTRAQGPQERRRGRVVAALALDGLDEDRRDLRRARRWSRTGRRGARGRSAVAAASSSVEVAVDGRVGELVDRRQERLVAQPVVERRAGDARGADRPAVERAPEGDDRRAARSRGGRA